MTPYVSYQESETYNGCRVKNYATADANEGIMLFARIRALLTNVFAFDEYVRSLTR